VIRTFDQAMAEVLAAFAPLGPERVSLSAALGRHTVAPFAARFDSPPFDHSAMDGYAVRAADVASVPATLTVQGESRAGGPPPAALAAGTAMRIFTGAPVPDGADSVVLQEDTTRDGSHVEVKFAAKPGANVRHRGSDLRAGEQALPAHARIGAGEIALLASQDVASVEVFRRPRVAILCTGDELRDIGEPARAGSIVNSNAYALAAQVQEAGAEPWVLPPVGDERALVSEAIRSGLSADVLVMSGGVSVGDHDVVRDALADAGITLGFWKVQMKPGKPVAFAMHGRVPVLGLPGNPVSAFVCFELFVRPGLCAMLGDPSPNRPRIRVRLARPYKHTPGRAELVRAQLSRDPRGFVAEVPSRQGSGSLPSIVAVDALVIIPAERSEVGTQEPLDAILIGRLPG
jgi:molybdopterin molybdotransferase